MRNERMKKIFCFFCLFIAATLLLGPFLWTMMPRSPDRYASLHPALTLPPLMGFSAESIFNIGTAEEIDAFPGIGEVYSQRIVEGRSILGGYQLPEELLLVKGIGEKRLAIMMEALTEELVEIPLTTE